MPIQSSSLLTADYTQDDIEASPESVRGATIEQAKSDLLGPSLFRMAELSAAGSTYGRAGGKYAERYKPEEASQFMADAGLDGEFTFDRDYNQNELSILANRKRAELRRQSILTRADQSKTAMAGRLGLQLVTSFLDPLTVASAFIPVVGEARYANLLAKAGGTLGRAGVRAAAGATEGAAGAAITEPIIAGAKHQEQADYTMADSLLNIAIGGVLGGGLHAAGGAIKDRITGEYAPKAKLAARIDEVLPQIDPRETKLLEQVSAARAELETADIEGRRVASELLGTERQSLEAVANSPEAKAIEGQWGNLETELTNVRAAADTMAAAVTKLYEPATLTAETERLAADPAYVANLRKRFNQRNVGDRIERQAKANIKKQRTELESALGATREQVADVQRKVDTARASNSAQVRLGQIDAAHKAGDVESLLSALPQDVEPRIRQRLSEAKRAANDFLNSDAAKAVEMRKASSQVASAMPDVREAALKSAVSQAVTGQPIEARPIFDRGMMQEAGARLNDPDQRPLTDALAVKRADDTIRAGETVDDAVIEKQVQELDAQLAALESDAELAGEPDMAELVATMRDEFKQSDVLARESSAHAELLAACAMRPV